MAVVRYGRDEAKAAAKEYVRGVFTAPCLPVDAAGEVDEAGLRRDVRHCIDEIGSSGLYIHGFYGHFWLLSSAQRRQVIEVAVDEVAEAVPVICRCAHPSPAETIALAKHAQQVGADFISLLGPQFGGAGKDIVLRYFDMVATEIDLGISVFNTMQAGYVISPELMAELASIPNVCALKNDLGMAHTIRVRELVGDEILVVDPDEENFLVNLLHFGQQAIYTGTNMMFDSAAAQPMKAYVNAALAGEREEAARLYYEMEPIRALHRRWVLQPWRGAGLCPLGTIKFWISQLGMTGGPVPAPLPGLDRQEQDKLRAELVAVGLVDEATGR